jgi:DNA-binding NtrC family response regulator
MTTILVIDGDSSARAAIQALLEMEGFEVVGVENDRSGIRALETSLFEAAIVDIFTPRIEGLDAIKTLKNIAPMVPIVALAPQKFRTCLGQETDFLEMAARLGAAAGLYKPFMPRDLITVIATCIDATGRTQRAVRDLNDGNT